MAHSAKLVKRDGRLSLALLLFVASAGALLYQAWIVFIWFFSALNQDWSYAEKLFPSTVQPIPPGTHCLDDCTPDLPFVAGPIGIVTFLLGLSILAYSWWVPKPRENAPEGSDALPSDERR